MTLRIQFLFIFICLFAASTFCQDIQFTDLANLPEGRSALTSANDGENIYIVNGFGETNPYKADILHYNIAQNTWSTLTGSTIAKRFASAAVVNDYLYVFNGEIQGDLNSGVEKINLSNGTVELLSTNPQPAKAAGVATWNNKIYSFGGLIGPNTYSNLLYEFDPENDTWSILSQIPFNGETKGEVLDGRLYIIGGWNGTVSNQIDVYNLSTNVWEANYTMPVGISAHSTATVGSKIYLVGDFTNLTSLACFDTADNSFQILTSNLNERRHCAAEGILGSLFALGGNTSSTIGSSITSVQLADIFTSTNEVTKIKLMQISPNPATDQLQLNILYDQVVIYDVQGKMIQKVSNTAQLNLSQIPNGIFFIKARKGRDIYHTKFIKK